MEHYYTFIRPQKLQPREPTVVIEPTEVLECIDWLVQQTTEVVHYDLETTGLNYYDNNQIVTNVGLAWDDHLVGLSLIDVPFEDQQPLWDWLGAQRLGGFNLGFDVAWLPDWIESNIASDTCLWFRLLATEMHFGQTHSLQDIIDRVICWPDADQQKKWLGRTLSKYHLSKNKDMWRLSLIEPYEYTKYCAMDAEASYQAHQVFMDTLQHHGFTELQDYFDTILVPKIKRNIQMCYSGLPVDRPTLLRNIELVKKRQLYLEGQIFNHPEFKPVLEEWVKLQLDKQHKLRITFRKEYAKASDKPWEDSHNWLIDAKPEKSLPQWAKPFGGRPYKPVKKFQITGERKPWPRFKFSSGPMMRWLIYEHWLKDNYEIKYYDPEKPERGGLLMVTRDDKTFELKLTKGGGLPTGGDILTIFGEVGNMINEYKSLETLMSGFLYKYELASRRDGRIHAQGKILGTATGRMSGGNGE